MAATNIETLTNPRDSLPNVFTNVNPREVDFVTVFGQNWDALRRILGIMHPIKKAPGTKLVSYSASVTLESGNVDPGCVIPYSKTAVVQSVMRDITVEKFAKGTTLEDVITYGADVAIRRTDEAFRTELQNKVLTKFYTFLDGGELEQTATTWQDALAKAQGEVLNKFADMGRSVTDIVGFANILDAYDYLGASEVTTQTQFGLTYMQNFMGYKTLILLPARFVARGKVYATPVENIVLYYVDPSDAQLGQLDLHYTVQGETNLIGFAVNGELRTAVGEVFAVMGMVLWAEYIDGIANVTFGETEEEETPAGGGT